MVARTERGPMSLRNRSRSGQGHGLVLVELLLGSEPKNNKEKQHETLKLAFRLI